MILSATRSFAHLLREFAATSASLAVTGFFVTILISCFFPHTHTGKLLGQVHGVSRYLNASFTALSSKE